MEDDTVSAQKPTDDWRHLLPFGYAPGNYMGPCRTCGAVCIDLDKRATSCRPCAEAKYAAREFTPAELALMNEEYRSRTPTTQSATGATGAEQ